MDSGQLTEPDPPEPPDPPSSPVRTSNRSFSPVKAPILCKSHTSMEFHSWTDLSFPRDFPSHHSISCYCPLLQNHS
ncbi:unnamed protein product [Brassica oleracea]